MSSFLLLLLLFAAATTVRGVLDGGHIWPNNAIVSSFGPQVRKEYGNFLEVHVPYVVGIFLIFQYVETAGDGSSTDTSGTDFGSGTSGTFTDTSFQSAGTDSDTSFPSVGTDSDSSS